LNLSIHEENYSLFLIYLQSPYLTCHV